MKYQGISVLIITLFLLPACSLLPAEEELPLAPVIHTNQQASYDQVAVTRGDIVKTITYQCSYKSASEETLAFQLNGEVIRHVYVRQGDSVEKGDLLAELDTDAVNKEIETQQNAISELELTIRHCKESRELAVKKEALLLQRQAAESGIDSEAYAAQEQKNRAAEDEYQELLLNYARQLSIERDRLGELNQKLNERRLYAGISGTARYVLSSTSGKELVSEAGKAVCVISDFSEAYFVAKLETNSFFQIGDIVSIIYNDEAHEAIVFDITENSEDKKTYVSFQLKIPDPALSAGSTGTIQIEADRRTNVLCLPSKSVAALQNAKVVYFVDENGVKSSKTVTTGLEANGMVEIVDGLQEGELVIE